MIDENKTKKQLIEKLMEMHRRIAEMGETDTRKKQTMEARL